MSESTEWSINLDNMELSRETSELLNEVIKRIQLQTEPKTFGDLCAIIINHIHVQWSDIQDLNNEPQMKRLLNNNQYFKNKLAQNIKSINEHKQRLRREIQRQPISTHPHQPQLRIPKQHSNMGNPENKSQSSKRIIEQKFTCPEKWTERMNSKGDKFSYLQLKPSAANPLDAMRHKAGQINTGDGGFIQQTQINRFKTEGNKQK